MLFSILIPVYNVEKYLEECLNSVLNQDFRDYEIIIVDDGSTDNSPQICDRYQKLYSGIIKVIHQKNRGLFATRRRLFEMANGKYCLCLDSDDFLEKKALAVLANAIEKYDPDFVFYDLYYLNDSNNKKWSDYNPLNPYIKYQDLNLLKNSLLDLSFINWSMCSKCVKRSIINVEDSYEQCIGISYGEDTLQSIVLYNNANNFVYINECIYNYRLGSGMTKKLSVEYLKDFASIAFFMKSHCRNWTINIDDCVNDYLSKIIIKYFTNIMETSSTFKEVDERVNEALLFVNNIKNYNINLSVCNSKFKKFLLQREWYHILYIIIKMKNKFFLIGK